MGVGGHTAPPIPFCSRYNLCWISRREKKEEENKKKKRKEAKIAVGSHHTTPEITLAGYSDERRRNKIRIKRKTEKEAVGGHQTTLIL